MRDTNWHPRGESSLCTEHDSMSCYHFVRVTFSLPTWLSRIGESPTTRRNETLLCWMKWRYTWNTQLWRHGWSFVPQPSWVQKKNKISIWVSIMSVVCVIMAERTSSTTNYPLWGDSCWNAMIPPENPSGEGSLSRGVYGHIILDICGQQDYV